MRERWALRAESIVLLYKARNYCVALIALDPDMIAGDHGMANACYEDLVKSQEVHGLVEEYVQKLNAELNRWETTKKWALLDHDLSVERGELTQSLKVKRSVVAQRYKALIDAFYT
jgi:long-chain acyl-CoA synthetase